MERKIIVGSEGSGVCGRYIIDYLLRIGSSEAVDIQWVSSKQEIDNVRPDLIVRFMCLSEEPEFPNSDGIPYISWTGEAYAVPDRSYPPICRLYSFKGEGIDWIPYGTCISTHKIERRYVELDKNFEVIACFSNPVPSRMDFTKLLFWRFGPGCRSIGRALNSVGFHQFGDFLSDSLYRTYSEAKFVLCMENTIKEGYITEKLLNAYISNAIPIYWGDSETVKQNFNPKSFVCVNDFATFQECIDEIGAIAQDEARWKQMLNEPIFLNDEAQRFWSLDPDKPSAQYLDIAKRIYAVLDLYKLQITLCSVDTVVTNAVSADILTDPTADAPVAADTPTTNAAASASASASATH